MEGLVLVLVLVLSCGLVDSDPGEPVVIGSSERFRAVVGADVVLPCHLEPPLDVTSMFVEWRLHGKTIHFYRNRTEDPELQNERFRGRTSLFHHEMTTGNISLKLTNVTEDDSGEFTCSVYEQGKGRVTLEVGNSVRFAIITAVSVMAVMGVVSCALMGIGNLKVERKVRAMRRSRIDQERTSLWLNTTSPQPNTVDSVSGDGPLQTPHPV